MADGDIFEWRLGKGWRRAFNEIRGTAGHWDEGKVAQYVLEALAHGSRNGLSSPCLPHLVAALTEACNARHDPYLPLDGLLAPSSLCTLRETLNKIISDDGGFNTGSKLAKQAALKVYSRPAPPGDSDSVKHAFAQALFREILYHQFLDRVEDGFIECLRLNYSELEALKERIYEQNVAKLEPFLIGLIEKPGALRSPASRAKHPEANTLEYLQAPLEVGHAVGR